MNRNVIRKSGCPVRKTKHLVTGGVPSNRQPLHHVEPAAVSAISPSFVWSSRRRTLWPLPPGAPRLHANAGWYGERAIRVGVGCEPTVCLPQRSSPPHADVDALGFRSDKVVCLVGLSLRFVAQVAASRWLSAEHPVTGPRSPRFHHSGRRGHPLHPVAVRFTARHRPSLVDPRKASVRCLGVDAPGDTQWLVSLVHDGEPASPSAGLFAQDHTSVIPNGDRSIFDILDGPVSLGWSFCSVPQVTTPVAWNLFHAINNSRRPAGRKALLRGFLVWIKIHTRPPPKPTHSLQATRRFPS
jgi:hypothetical protein